MNPHTTAAIVSQGDELVLGQTLDTNSKWLSERLLAQGLTPVEHVTLPDDLDAIAAAFTRLAGRVDVIVCTGGLGPTADDLTREALARAMGEALVEDASALEQIRSWFRGRGRSMPVLNEVQARRPVSARCLENTHGTAPGLHAAMKVGTRWCDVFCLPGPPRELFPMFAEHVVPALRPAAGAAVRAVALHTIGLGESDVATMLAASPRGDLMSRDRSPTVGTTASNGIVSVRVRAHGAGADEHIAQLLPHLREILGTVVFRESTDNTSPHVLLPKAVLDGLRSKRQTVATAESCTGGLLGAAFTDIPGSSASYAGGWVTYSNAMKTRELGVPEALFSQVGAVSREVVCAMAQGGRERAKADWCLSVSGVAGPDGGTAEKPVGTVWIALAGPDGVLDARRFAMGGDRGAVREWSVKAALAMLWFHLAGTPERTLLRQAR